MFLATREKESERKFMQMFPNYKVNLLQVTADLVRSVGKATWMKEPEPHTLWCN